VRDALRLLMPVDAADVDGVEGVEGLELDATAD
jgi:hypothetical protein